MNQNTEIIKKNLLETICYFHKFCQDNNLEYFLIGGSLLGAIRHKGFIPWDDDIDIAMSRDDYNKLIKLSHEIKQPFEFLINVQNSSYIYPYAKIVNNNLIVEEQFYKPFQCGIWIDVFPLDITFTNSLLRKIHFSLVNIVRKVLILKYGSFKTAELNKLELYISKLLYPITCLIPRSLLNSAFSVLESYPKKIFKQNQVVANLYGAWGVKESAPKEIFKKKKLYKFEGYEFWGVSDSDFWLSKVYGDYMRLPPKDKQIPEHLGRIVSIKDSK